MERKIRCAHCQKLVRRNPRIRNQRYCGAEACQKARKRRWQSNKMAADSDYRETQRDYARKWRERHPDYWQQYRAEHPGKVERNRVLQRLRNARRDRPEVIANSDASDDYFHVKSGRYYILPVIAKMDASKREVYLISAG